MSLVQKSFSFAGRELSIHSFTDNNGVVWMLANPFAEMLGYKNRKVAIQDNVSADNKMSFGGGLKTATTIRGGPGSKIQAKSKFINKKGLYELIMRSTMPNAVEFQMWITSDVLPGLEERGSYSMKQAPIQQQEQMNAIHQIVDGVPATWYDEKIVLLERERQVLLRNEQLAIEKEELYKKMLGMTVDVVKRPKDNTKHHILCVYYVGSQESEFVYRGVRCQKRSLSRARPPQEELIYSSESPNAINAFNRVKDHIGPHQTYNNLLYCSIPPSEMYKRLSMK